MTKWLKAARQAGTRDKWDKTDKTPPETPEMGGLSQKSHLSHVPGAEIRTFEPRPRDNQTSPYGQTIGGLQRTWTGKVVSLSDWRNLTEWERHGSTGKIWNGITRKWEPDQ